MTTAKALTGVSTPAPLGSQNPSNTLALTVELSERDLRVLADLVAERLARCEPQSPRSTWLTSDQAAEHLCCSRDRVHDLVALGKLQPRRDGRRLLFKRDELDTYVEQSA